MKLLLSLLKELRLTFVKKAASWTCLGIVEHIIKFRVLIAGFFFLLKFRDGMIKRPGNEGYLNKLIEEERKIISVGLQLGGN